MAAVMLALGLIPPSIALGVDRSRSERVPGYSVRVEGDGIQPDVAACVFDGARSYWSERTGGEVGADVFGSTRLVLVDEPIPSSQSPSGQAFGTYRNGVVTVWTRGGRQDLRVLAHEAQHMLGARLVGDIDGGHADAHRWAAVNTIADGCQ